MSQRELARAAGVSQSTVTTIDNNIVWAVVEQHTPQLHHALAAEIDTARSLFDTSGK